jgi:uncharacterized protein (TIRG00374 family)
LTQAEQGKSRNAWKLIPGFAISAFFLWKTLQSIRWEQFHALRLAQPLWLVAIFVALSADYGLRAYRWWCMLRGNNAKFSACFRVLLTSLAANNILPFRIGDFMRIFAYAPDVNAPSSTVLSTVVLERLLDIFMLFAFLLIFLTHDTVKLAPMHIHGHIVGIYPLAAAILLVAAVGLGLLLFGTHLLHSMTQWLVAKFGQHPRMAKVNEWAVLLFDAVLRMSFVSRVWLVVLTAMVWTCEGMVFVSTAKAIGLESAYRGPWLAATLSNLSFLLPSAPGGIGPFEASAKLAMETHGVDAGSAAVYALLVHVIVFFAVTTVGGIGFLMHRKERGAATKPIVEDLAALPKEIELGETL